MNSNQLKVFLKANEKSTAKAIQVTVNGKIDKLRTEIKEEIRNHNMQHENDMQRILPVINSYEEAQRDLLSVKKGGRFALWLAGTITILGGAILVLRSLFQR